MSVRIGGRIIETSDWDVERYDIVIRELKKERSRKLKAEELKNRLLDLLAEARENGFDFVEKDFGYVLTSKDYELYDNNPVGRV